MKFSKLNRDIHRWGSVIIAIPLVVIIVSGLLLQLKKEFAWIQPPTQSVSSSAPSISFEEILLAIQGVPECEVKSWADIDRLDVRPSKGIIKVRCKNRWEIQLDANNGQVLQVAYRRSDLIESIHDGSFFHELVKIWVFLPATFVLAILWGTGLYLFFLPYYAKWKKKQKRKLQTTSLTNVKCQQSHLLSKSQ